MGMGRYICLISFSAISLTGCKKPYAPPIIASNVNYLVVEGVINSGQDSTVINLSRTVRLSGKTKSNPELNAKITVESDQNTNYPIKEIGNGKYASPTLNLNPGHKYRLDIVTTGNITYQSDFESVRATPPIDSVGFAKQNDGIQIYVNTHDPNNNTRYYRWDYTETWQFHALYQSLFITDGQKIVLRTPGQQIYSCFGNNNSSSITLGSSAKLQQDVIYQNPITQVASTSEKLESKYSILVNQYALTADAFNFWQNLKKNTEQLGSIFDPQPSNLNGNIHCITTPTEPVIGYISVTNIQQKRIFIDNSQLSLAWRPAYPYQCEIDTSFFSRPPTGQNDVALFLIPIGSAQVPIAQLHPPNRPEVIGYLGASVDCVDCTIRGTTKQPIFWK
jgi:hypothetical protein